MLQRTEKSVTPDSTGQEIAAAVLEDLKDPARWCKGFFQYGNARCLMGSAFAVTGLPIPYAWGFGSSDAHKAVGEKLARAMGFEGNEFDARSLAIDFNNSPDTTHEMLVERLRAAL